MRCKRVFALFSASFLLVLSAIQLVNAQAVGGEGGTRQLVSPVIDESRRVTLRGNTRPEARAQNDRGPVADDFPLQHMLLQLRRPPELEKALQQFIDGLQTLGSANFHQWITAAEFGARFGPAKGDLDTVTRWLESHGFQVNVVYPSGMVIDFSGTAGQVRSAFQTEIHHLEINGEKHIANISNPRIPAALAPLVSGVVSLHDFGPHAMHHMRMDRTAFTFPDPYGGTSYAVVPADLATIYNLNPLFSAGYSGQGQTVVLIEDTDVFSASDWSAFRSAFGLSTYTSATFTSVHPAPPTGPNNCGAPGVIAPNDAEAILDAEWASAAAPSAAIEMAACADTATTFGGLIAVQNLINAPNPPPIMSISYGECETINGAAANAAYYSAYQQAVAEGVSVFVAAGDSGAAGCDNSVTQATHGIGANAFASTPYNVAVGGTDFSDTYSNTSGIYWNSANSSAYGSALSYIPEIPWNDSCAGALLSQYEGYSATYGSNSLCNDSLFGSFLQTTVAGGGAPSACATGTPSTSGVVSGTCQGWAKPAWQAVLGNPNDGVRDTPDVSLFAADGLWGHFYVFCWSDTAHGGATCSGDPSGWSGAGGTSFAAPIMAGIQALVNQRTASRQGNPNPAYYQLAASEYGSSGNSACNSSNGNTVADSCIFYDVTLGDMDVDCGGPNCYLGGGSVGVLSTSNSAFAPAYGTTIGWDFATGIGTVNAANLVNNWPGSTPIPNFTLSATPGSLTIIQGASGTSTIAVTAQNGFNGSVSLSASGLPSGVTAAFSPNPASASSTLTLTASSTATSGTATVTITGASGTLTRTTTVSLTVNPAPTPSFTLSASPASLTVKQGTSGTSTVSVTPQNGFNGNVSLSASGLPSGVTASFSPNPASTSSTLTLTASATATTGTATVTITGASGSVTSTTTVSLTVQIASILPSGWFDGDIGATGMAGNAIFSNGTFTVQGAGAQIYGTADAFHFVYQRLSGDGTITARLVSLQGGSGSVTAGVMIRETLTAGSSNAKTADWPSYGRIYFDVRSTTGGSTTEPGSVGAALPYWIKVTRSGNVFTSYVSSDGTNWVQVGTTTVSMAANVYLGLAVNSGTTTALATATFDNVSVSNVASQPLPSPWLDQDVGSVGLAGRATFSNGTFTVQGAGAQIYGTADAFHFAYQPLSGDGSITARLVSLQGAGSAWSTAGVMIRETLTAGSSNAKTADWPSYGRIYFDVRATTGGGTTEPGSVAATLPYWIKVTRSGNLFTSYASSDGINWVQVGTTQTISMAPTVYVGLAVNSGTTTALASATFDNVSVGVPAPNFTLSASPASLAITQGTSGTSTVAITPQNGFSGNVTLSASGLPSGVTAAFSPNPASASTLTLTAGSTAATGTATVTITGTSGSLTSTTTVSLTVNPAPTPNFSLSASPASLTVTQGAAGTSTITVAPQNGFNGSVSLSASGLPNGVTAAFSPNPASAGSTLTLTAGATATTGTATVTITGTSGSLTQTTSLSLTVRMASTLPSGWTDGDIGATGVTGSASYANNAFTVQGAGTQIYGTADAFHFVYQSLSGDGAIIARLVSLQGGSGSVTAGVMIREALTAGSTNAKTADWASYGRIYFDARTTTGGSTTEPGSVAATLPYWIKVTRSGGLFTSYASSDGVNWVQVGTPQTISMAPNVSVGLAVNSGSTTALASATFDNVSVSSIPAQPLPSPWLDQDIGSVGVAGRATFSSGTFTVQGAGTQIYGAADAFNFAYQPLSGDGTIIARLVSVQGGSGSVTAGVMIREALSAGSTNAKTADWPSYGRVYFDVRSATGGSTTEPGSVAATTPYWIKVTRSGNLFTSYASSDGVNWVQVGTSQTISMAANVYVGLAVNSGTTSTLVSATFDSVSVTSP